MRSSHGRFSLLRQIDQTIAVCGMTCLILCTPLVVGSVEPWAFSSMEAIILLILVSSLASRLVFGDESQPGTYQLTLPAGLFLAVVAFEMVPLPPAIERTISVSTFNLYQNLLPKWPDRAVYDSAPTGTIDSAGFAVLPTSAEIAEGASVPFVKNEKQDGDPTALGRSFNDQRERLWHPLSLASSLTGPALLKLLVYLCLFVLIVSYPSSDHDEFRFPRMLVRAVLVAGVLTAVAALLGRVFPNGKVLWVFTPYDWPQGNPWGLRAASPFANPDHLADYLDMVLPVAVAGFLMPWVFATKRPATVRLFSGGAIILVGSSLLLTCSRAGWLGALIGLVLLAELWRKRQMMHRIPHAARIAGWGSLGMLVLAILLIVGPGGRKQTDLRLEQSLAQNNIVSRLEPAKLSLKMIRDYPIFGVGLGCWPEVFPHYAQPPWSPIFWNATHNDYAQLGAETGLIGFGLVAWFFAPAFIRIWRGTQRIKDEAAVLSAGCLAGISAVGVHEFLDFSLQTPANALLFTVLLSIAVRLTQNKPPQLLAACGTIRQCLRAIALVCAMALIPVAFTQRAVPYPYNIKLPATLGELYSLVKAHPGNAKLHLIAARWLHAESSAKYQTEELRSALWLEPMNPFGRDLYAQTLLRSGKKEEALGQITVSVSYSPTLTTHLYLQPRIIPWLSKAEQTAVERGFRIAVQNGYEGAVPSFASYYDFLGKFSTEAGLYYGVAVKEHDHMVRAEYFSKAGTAYAKAREFQKAQISFLAAANAAPEDSNAYEQLILQVFGPQNNFADAKATIARAIQKGVDPFDLNLALSEAARKSRNNADAEAALQKAVAMRPSSIDGLRRLGELELAMNRYDRAANWFQKAAELNPSSADAFYDLGLADEGAYEYFAADQAFQRALALAPADEEFKAHYAAFHQKIMQNRRDISTP